VAGVAEPSSTETASPAQQGMTAPPAAAPATPPTPAPQEPLAPPVQIDPQVKQYAQDFANFQQRLDSFRVEITANTAVKEGNVRRQSNESFILTVRRPNRLALTGQTATIPRLWCDGEKCTVYIPELNQYLQQPAPARLADLLKAETDTGQLLGRIIPLIKALIGDDPYNAFMEDVLIGKYLGEGSIEGVTCHIMQFEQQELDWKVWLQATGEPMLRRIEADFTKMLQKARLDYPGMGDFAVEQSWDFRNWQINPPAAGASGAADEIFKFVAPAMALQVESFQQMNEPVHPLVGKAAPELELDLLDGGKLKLAELKGKEIVILDFWATWCKPCRMQMPLLEELVKNYADKGVKLYAVNQQEDGQKIREFLNTIGLKPTVALDPNGVAGELYGAESIPQTVLIDKAGKVQAVHTGFSEATIGQLRTEIEALLTGKDLVKVTLDETGQPLNVDLACKSISFSPEAVQTGDKITFSCEVTNNGTSTVPAGTYYLALIIEGKQVILAAGDQPIPPAGMAVVKVDGQRSAFQVFEPGEYIFHLIVDPYMRLTESDEKNNLLNGTLKVSAVAAPTAPAVPAP